MDLQADLKYVIVFLYMWLCSCTRRQPLQHDPTCNELAETSVLCGEGDSDTE